MQSRFLAVAALMLCLQVPDVLAQERIQFFAVVLDGTGQPVETLGTGDVFVREGDEDATVVAVEPVHWPVRLQVLVDNGSGLGAPSLEILKNGIRGLLEAVPEDVPVTLVSTSPQPRFLARETSDREVLTRSVGLLTPDNGSGRFTESLEEATKRIADAGDDFLPVIVSVGTTVGDIDVRERDVNRIFERLQERPIMVHVVMLQQSSGANVGGGVVQTELGIAVTNATGGCYENIAAPTRLSTLLPEIGETVAEAHQLASQQYLLTVERPAGRSGDLGPISAAATTGRVVQSLSLDGRIR